MRFITAALVLLAVSGLQAQTTLTITEDSTTIVGGTYDNIVATGVKYLTLRNVTVRNTSGTNHYAGIALSGCSRVLVESCVVDGGAGTSTGFGTCGGIKLDGTTRAVIRDCEVYAQNDDGFRLYQANVIDIIRNKVYNLISCGIDGVTYDCDCNNGHSDGIQIIDCIKVNVIGNVFYNSDESTSAIGPGGGTSIVIANNIVQWPGAYYPVYLMGFFRSKVFNNTFWAGRSRGSIWFEFGINDLEFYNNIVRGLSLVHNAPYDPAEHTIENNLFYQPFNYDNTQIPASNINGADPQFTGMGLNQKTWDMDVSDFELKATSPAIDAGYSGTDIDIPETDFYGMARNGTPDIGALEYGGISGFEHLLHNVPGAPADITVTPSPMAHKLHFGGTDLHNADVRIRITDTRGKLIHRYEDRGLMSGHTWDGCTASRTEAVPGIYYYTLTVNGNTTIGKIIKSK